MSVLSQSLVICGKFWFSAFIWRKLRLRLIECSQVFTVRQNHWEWLNKPLRNASKLREWFRSKEIGFLTSWSREILNGISLLVNSCFKDRIRRGFYIALWPATKNGFTTITPSAENHGKCPDMPPRRRPDWIFTLPRLCSAFGGTSSVWSIMSYWNRVKPSQGIGIERNWLSKNKVSNFGEKRRKKVVHLIRFRNLNLNTSKSKKIIGWKGRFFRTRKLS